MRWRKSDYKTIAESGRAESVRRYVAELDFGTVDRLGRRMGCLLYVEEERGRDRGGATRWISGVQALRDGWTHGSSHRHRDRRLGDLSEAKANAEAAARRSMARAVRERGGKAAEVRAERPDPVRREPCGLCGTPTAVSRLKELRYAMGGRVRPLATCPACRYGPRNVETTIPTATPLSGPLKGVTGQIEIHERDGRTGEVVRGTFRWVDPKTGEVRSRELTRPKLWRD